MNIHLAGQLTGIETAQQIHNHYNIPFIYLTGSHNSTISNSAKITQPSGYIFKPFDDNEIKNSIETALINK